MADLIVLGVGGLRPINNPSDSTVEDVGAVLDPGAEDMHQVQEELLVDLNKASEVEVLTLGVVFNLAGLSS